MQRMLPALVFAVLIHAMLLLADAGWLIRHESIAPSAQVVTMRLVERAPYCPPAMRSLPTPPPPLPKPQRKPVVKKPVVPKQAVKKKPVVPKPTPVVRKIDAKRLSTPPSAQPVPMLAAAEPDHESSKPPSVVSPDPSADNLPLSRSVLDSPAMLKDAATAPATHATKTTAVATVVMARPRYSDNPPPAYPSIARKRGYEGTVIVDVFVEEDGRVGDLRIAESSTYKLLDRSAVKAVKRWQFEPGRQAGKTVAMWVRVPLKFSLK